MEVTRPLLMAIWGGLLITWVFFWLWHRAQEKNIRFRITHKEKEFPVESLLPLIGSRSAQALFFLALLFISVGYLLFLHSEVREKSPEIISAIELPNGPTNNAAGDSAMDTLINATAIETTRQAKLDAIKEHYENLLILYFYLHNCGLAPDEDYTKIYTALVYKVRETGADEGVSRAITQAAQGSYTELYSRTECTADITGPMRSNYDRFIKGLDAP